MSYFNIVKPYTSYVTFALQIDGSWQDRSASQYQCIQAFGGYYRQMRANYSTTSLPSGKRMVRITDDDGMRFFKRQGNYNLSGSYSSAKSTLLSSWTEITRSEFMTANDMVEEDHSRYMERLSYTTAENGWSYTILWPDTYLVDDVAYVVFSATMSHGSVSPASGQYPVGTNMDVILTPDTGYRISSTPTVTGATITWTQQGDQWAGSFTLTQATFIDVTTEAKPVYYPITYNLSHCTVSPRPTTILAGDTLNLAFTPDTGYELFTNPPTLVQTAATGYAINYYPPSYTVTGSLDDIQSSVTVTATATVAPTTINVINNAQNILVSPDISTAPYYQRLELYLSLPLHYTISTPPLINGMSPVYDETTKTWYFDYYPVSDLTITGEAVQDKHFSFIYEVTGGSVYPPADTVYYVGDTVTIVVTADPGLYFQTPPRVVYVDWTGSQLVVPMTATDDSEYPTVFVWEKTLSSNRDMITQAYVRGTAQARPLIDDFGVFNVWAPTLLQLTDIANKRFDYSESGQYYYRDVDLSTFILSLKRVYVPVDMSTSTNVMLGGYDTGVQAASVIYPYTTVDCGSVDIMGLYNNELDYKYTDIEFYLPFYGMLKVDTERYINKSVSIVYECELITGQAVISLIADTETIDIVKCSIASDIPYILTLDAGVKSKYAFNEMALLDKTPYVTISSNLQYDTTHIKAKNNAYRLISSLHGYQEIDVDYGTIPATKAELEMIKRLLKEGVVIDTN